MSGERTKEYEKGLGGKRELSILRKDNPYCGGETKWGRIKQWTDFVFFFHRYLG